MLGWSFSPKGYAGTEEVPIPPELEVSLPDSSHRIRPTFAVRATPKRAGPQPGSDETPHSEGKVDHSSDWQLVVLVRESGEALEEAPGRAAHESISPHRLMERLLRQTGVPAGLLFNGTSLRLMSAPKGESSGWLDFRVADMLQTSGRPIIAALRGLLGQARLLSVGRDRNLAALLHESRKYQNNVSERLAEQVLHALYELLRGFQAAHNASKEELLGRMLKEDPNEIYSGLLTLVMRLIFLLYAEEHDMLPQDSVFLDSYSLAGLQRRLQEDAARHPDTMDQRYGAYAQIVALSRIVHDGARLGETLLPPRRGNLFDPDRYPFLEGRDARTGEDRDPNRRLVVPLVPDGTIHRVLEKLIVLDGERISYRALDVEHIGSVYETMMGFRLEVATGRSISIKAAKKHGAPTTVDVEQLQGIAPVKRAKWLQERTDRKLTDKVRQAVQGAVSFDDMHAALLPVIDKEATPDFVPGGAMVFQPNEERRRTGSHYTPRELSEPIVTHTLEPILDRLRKVQDGPPTPEQILDLKVCDPAMGSGAFLVAACRLLANELVKAWHAHDAVPSVPPDENEVILARRLVAQKCLYGVDRNPNATDLAKMSLWLATLAKDHPLTFLDHALRHGDSLVGLTSQQIRAFHWKKSNPQFQAGFATEQAVRLQEKFKGRRRCTREMGDATPEEDLERRRLWDEAESVLDHLRVYGDLASAAFFKKQTLSEREEILREFAEDVRHGNEDRHRTWLIQWRRAELPLAPFHWEMEFPEVFDQENPGFDAIVGNPPFAGKNTMAASNVPHYLSWLKELHEQSHGNADLVAHFFRRAYGILRDGGTFGLIATNTICQGDTRATGLRWICENGGIVFRANRRRIWPGLATVIVSVVHVMKPHKSFPFTGKILLDDRSVDIISAFLFPKSGNNDPARLSANAGQSFIGSYVLNMGFTFSDSDRGGETTSIADMRQLIAQNPDNKKIIFPFMGGKDLNSSPTHTHDRYIINFSDYPLDRKRMESSWRGASAKQRQQWFREGTVPLDYPNAVARDWPELIDIVERKVKPLRERLSDSVVDRGRKKKWWQYGAAASGLYRAIHGMSRVLVICYTSKNFAFAFLPVNVVYDQTLIVFPVDSHAMFCVLQSLSHETWVRNFGSTLGDGIRYSPSDCFETFPLPCEWQESSDLKAAGKACHDYRADLMIRNNEGLTKTYNRFHNPHDRSEEIEKLRQLHMDMDRAVADSYGWTDIPTDRKFLLDHDIDEEEWGDKKKPYRYRWPDEVQVEVLARLLELNATRAKEEQRAGPTRPTPEDAGQSRACGTDPSLDLL